ncbi:MAG TPA: hypothetical protein VH416_00220 [Gaiellaceae bacterium]|jgi:hypothetical protein
MSPRFITNLLLVLAGAFVVVVSQGFSSGVTGWITFGVGLGILAMLGVAQLDRARGLPQRLLDGLAGALGIWTVIASVVFSAAALTWLSFGEALGFVALALAGLLAHELSTERVVHSLAVAESRTAADDGRAASKYSAA